MALTSSSTLSDALDQYKDNLLWEGNITKAQNCLEAIRFLLVNRAQSKTINGRTSNYESLISEKTKFASRSTFSGIRESVPSIKSIAFSALREDVKKRGKCGSCEKTGFA